MRDGEKAEEEEKSEAQQAYWALHPGVAMTTVLNVKVGSKVTFRDTSSGALLERDAEVIEFPKILRVKTDDGALHDIKPEDVLAEEPGKSSAGRLPNRFQSRL